MESTQAEYKIWDSRNQVYLQKIYTNRKAANRWTDKQNAWYGAYRYFVSYQTPLGSVLYTRDGVEEF